MSLRLRLMLSVSLTIAGVSSLPAAGNRPIVLEVDAREAPRKLFHAKLTIPAAPGALTLAYPKWIPGEHGPTGPINDLAGVRFSAAGKPVPWSRDPLDMYLFHLDVPAGADTIDAVLDYLSPAETGQFSSGSSATANLALVSWNQLLLYPYPAPGRADELLFAATIQLPEGWKWATALAPAPGPAPADSIRFAPVPLSTLVDSPLLAGRHFRVITLNEGAPVHRIDIAADSDIALAMSPELEGQYRSLVGETGALFGARHYRHYDFLLTLSDHTAHFGLEHHESSDDRVDERSLVEADRRKLMAGLLPHEVVHSWNGKYRRPSGLGVGSFQEPMRGDLLWVYEGLTQYLGQVLSARSGLLTGDQYREALALTAAEMDHQKGRAWRPLRDTAVAAQVLYGARGDWAALRRGTDFYEESELLWLEADALIRRETKGRKSLDDFCRLFFGGESGPPRVVPYTFDDVVAALNQVAAWDWKGFWTKRLDTTEPGAPLEGIAAAGWKLVYTEEIPDLQRAAEETQKVTDVRFSIGISVREDGTIPDIVPGSAAAGAGLGPGMKLVAVNGRRWNAVLLRDAIRNSKTQPISLIVESGEFFKTVRLEYAGPERYPHLERDTARPDLFVPILRPLSARSAEAKPGKPAR